jgi:hypothetical protein
MEFRIIFSLQYSISINTFEVDPPSDSLHNAVVKPKNRARLWAYRHPYRSPIENVPIAYTNLLDSYRNL